MVASQRPKPLDKQEICRKVTAVLKKAYHSTPPRKELPVLETLLYAICLEDSTPDVADKVYERLFHHFRDLNEARVSSISELQAVFQDQDHSAWRALRLKNALQFAFDSHYAFELESLKRKTAELATKQLNRIVGVSYFARAWLLSHCLGSHVLPVDDRMHAVLVWLGLVDHESQPEQAAESLRGSIRKADAPLFCHLLRCLALDPKRSKVFAGAPRAVDRAATADEGLHRLEVLMNKGPAAVPKSTVPPVKTVSGGKSAAAGKVASAAKAGAPPAKPATSKTASKESRPVASPKADGPHSKLAGGKPVSAPARTSTPTVKPGTKSAPARPSAPRSGPAKGDTGKPARRKGEGKSEGRGDTKKNRH